MINDTASHPTNSSPGVQQEIAPQLQDVMLPGGSTRIRDAAQQFGDLLAATGRYYRRGEALTRVHKKDGRVHLQLLKPDSFPSVFEEVGRLHKFNAKGKKCAATCNTQRAKEIVAAEPFQNAVPEIKVITNCPVLVERDEELVTITGYDHEFGIFAQGAEPESMSPADAVRLLKGLLHDFRFSTDADKARALVALITPALVFGGLLGGRAPIDLGEADASQAGKGYRNKVTAAIYGEKVAAIAQQKGGVGSLEERFNSMLIRGRPFISFDNVRGKPDSQLLESFMTEDTYTAREPYSGNVEVDPTKTIVMLTSNKAEMGPDLANRSSIVKILKQPDGYNFQKYEEGGLLEHVRANQLKYLGAVYTVVNNWHSLGKPRTEETGHDFRQWVQRMDCISQNILQAGPIMDGHRQTQQRMTSPHLGWLRDVALAVEQAGQTDNWIKTHEILNLIQDLSIDIPGLGDGEIDDSGTRDKVLRGMGSRLGSCFKSGDSVDVGGVQVEREITTDDLQRPLKLYQFSPTSSASLPNFSVSPSATKTRGSVSSATEPKHFSDDTPEGGCDDVFLLENHAGDLRRLTETADLTTGELGGEWGEV